MSAYLGKIHYWLFNKIMWFEGLEEEIIKLVSEEELDIEIISEKINKKYGERLPKLSLEDMIDKSNIHGWLQGKIHAAEGRMAAWITEVLKKDGAKDKLENIYITQGMQAAEEVKARGVEQTTALEIFNSINDYILDGMPCDRVNEVITSSDDRVEWRRKVCVHTDIWTAEGGSVNYFYGLRELWIKAFVTEINSSFRYIEKEDGTKVIEKSMTSEEWVVYDLGLKI
ncbi:MAG: hypothetical protein RR851_03410 [Clostridium sp.]